MTWKSGSKMSLRALLPSANISAEWTSWVWKTTADSNGHLAHFFLEFEMCQTPSAATNPGSSNKNKKCAKRPLLSAAGFCTPLDVQDSSFLIHFFPGQRNPLRTYHGVYFSLIWKCTIQNQENNRKYKILLLLLNWHIQIWPLYFLFSKNMQLSIW